MIKYAYNTITIFDCYFMGYDQTQCYYYLMANDEPTSTHTINKYYDMLNGIFKKVTLSNIERDLCELYEDGCDSKIAHGYFLQMLELEVPMGLIKYLTAKLIAKRIINSIMRKMK